MAEPENKKVIEPIKWAPAEKAKEWDKKASISNGVEKISSQKSRKFYESRDKLQRIRDKKDRKYDQEQAEKLLDFKSMTFDMWPGKFAKKSENFVESPEIKEKNIQIVVELAQKEATQSLKEKHDAEIEETLREVDFGTLDEDTKKSLHADTLSKKIDITKVSQLHKKEALKSFKGPDGKAIDTTKLTADQLEIVQRYEAKKYLEALAQVSQDIKNIPNQFTSKLSELEKQNPGITDFAMQHKVELLTQEDFFEAAKKDPSLISETIKSIKTDGLIATGIDPSSELGRKLVAITQGNIDEYIKLFPEEADIKKLTEILDGSYVDILGGVSFNGLDKFQWSIDTVRWAIKDSTFREGILREDYKTEKEYLDALEKNARESTWMGVKQIERVAKKISRSKLSPFVKFLADLFAPLGALMPGEVGEFWREYLKNASQNEPDKSMWSGGGGSFEQLAEVDSSALINAARQYLGRPYKMGWLGRKDVPGDPIDCSQLVVNSLIDTGCLPPGSDTTAMGFAGMSQKIWTAEWKEGDFLIMSQPSPHIAIITANLWGGRYKTIESASGKGGVVETERSAGDSFSVYRNPFLEWNGGIKRRGMPKDLTEMKNIMKSTEIEKKFSGWIEGAADNIKANQARYERVAQATGVPWELIGAIHYRESSFDFGAALHNGDKIIGTGRKTYRVPANRWPFNTWEESAIDALRMKWGLGFTSINWSDDHLRRVAAYAEKYNGYGYRNRGDASPYVWSGTPLYKWGRFVADHVYDKNSVDTRPWVMPIIMTLLKKNNVQPPADNSEEKMQLAGTAADWFRKNDDKLYGEWKDKYDCMTSVDAALGLGYGSTRSKEFRNSHIDIKNSKWAYQDLWNVAMVGALYTGLNIKWREETITRDNNGYFGGEKAQDPTNIEYHIEENIMKRTEWGKKVLVPGSTAGTLIHYGAWFDRTKIVEDLKTAIPEGKSAIMWGTGEGTNQRGHEWLVVKEKWELKVYESTNTSKNKGDWRGLVNGINGIGYNLIEYLNNRQLQHAKEAIIFAQKS